MLCYAVPRRLVAVPSYKFGCELFTAPATPDNLPAADSTCQSPRDMLHQSRVLLQFTDVFVLNLVKAWDRIKTWLEKAVTVSSSGRLDCPRFFLLVS